MILTDIKQYLQTNNRAVLIDLARHFDVTPDAMRGMLEHWIRKGKIKHLKGNICSKGCCQSKPADLEIYEWIGV